MRRNWKVMGARAGLVASALLLGLVVAQGTRLSAQNCFINWLYTDPTCYDETDQYGDFTYHLHTQYFSQDKGTWTLAQGMANPGGGIATQSVSPTAVVIVEDEQTHSASGSFTTTCWGTLASAGTGATSQCNAWDNSATPDCSGGRSVTIKAYLEECSE